jgi:eukaryotic-like serine/threonine-protein kinase
MSAEELTPDPTPQGDPLLGILVNGRYRVLSVIGEGGMGKVYEALHEGLGRAVAIKVLGAAWASDEATIRRFHREARTASNIGHRAIVDVSDLGRLDDGRPYLVMERLRGDSFADLLDVHGRLPPERVAHLIEDVASALDAVHARGIVHRDIKPENLITIPGEDGGPEQVKLLDFGLAAFALPSAENARLTRHGQMHGTPHYMAPESGEEALPDYRADVYSLAVVAYELLSGFVPFDSKNPLQILTRKMHEDPPSLRVHTGLELSDEVEWVLARGLARRPDERHTSAGHFARDLAEAIGKLPSHMLAISGTHPRVNPRGSERETQGHSQPLPLISSRPPPPLTEPEVAPRARRRQWLAVAAGAAVFVVGAVAFWLAGGAPAPADETPVAATPTDAPPVAEAAPAMALPEPTGDTVGRPLADEEPEPSDEASGNEDEASAAADEADQDAPEADDGARKAATKKKASRAAAKRRVARAKAAPEPKPPAPKASGGTPATRKDPGDTPTLATSDRERSMQLSKQGTSALVQGRLPEAISHFRDATLAFPGNASAWRGLGLANERLGRRPEAAQAYRRYLRLAPNAGDATSVKQRLATLEGGG